MSREMLRLGLIGAGAVSQVYAEALRGSETARISAVADVRAEAASALARRVGCAAYPSHEGLADEGRVDAAIVCTPPSTHAQICHALIARGIGVLCEKPLTTEAHTAQQLIREAEAAQVVFTMASKFRYVDDVIRAKSLLAQGLLGKVVLLENAFTSRVDMSQRWNSDPAVAGGGVLIDNGTHSVDIFRYFLGPIVAVETIECRRVQRLPVEDTVRLLVRSRSGVLGSIDLSWSVNKAHASYIDIHGSEGTMRVGWTDSRYRLRSSPEWTAFGSGYNKLLAFRRQVENFCLAVRGAERLQIDSADVLASVQVIEAAYRSARRGGWVGVAGAEGSLQLREQLAGRA